MADRIFTRVVVACDGVGENRSSIATAARLAAWLDIALHGIFVEDEALLNLAAMPFARHTGASGETFNTIDERTTLLQFKAQAARIRAALEMAAAAEEVGWTFDIVRGSPSVSSLDIGDQDLLVIEAESRPFAGTLRFDSRWLAAAFETHRSILLLRGDANAHAIVALVQTDSPAQLIAAATKLASGGDRSLTLLIANATINADAVRKAVRAVSENLGAHCRIERMTARTLANIATPGSFLLVDASPTANDAERLRELLATTRANILFLRSH